MGTVGVAPTITKNTQMSESVINVADQIDQPDSILV